MDNRKAPGTVGHLETVQVVNEDPFPLPAALGVRRQPAWCSLYACSDVDPQGSQSVCPPICCFVCPVFPLVPPINVVTVDQGVTTLPYLQILALGQGKSGNPIKWQHVVKQ